MLLLIGCAAIKIGDYVKRRMKHYKKPADIRPSGIIRFQISLK
jgi:hypothetical protein